MCVLCVPPVLALSLSLPLSCLPPLPAVAGVAAAGVVVAAAAAAAAGVVVAAAVAHLSVVLAEVLVAPHLSLLPLHTLLLCLYPPLPPPLSAPSLYKYPPLPRHIP